MDAEFKVVRSKRSKRHNWPSRRVTLKRVEDECVLPLTSISRRIENAEKEIDESLYYKDLLEVINFQLEEHCLNTEVNSASIDEILCYGIGSFSGSVCARYQLALLLNLRKHFKSDVYVYDPIFNEAELSLLKDIYGFNLISSNEEGKRSCTKGKLSFAYFPHCPHWLVNNFLWKNWGEHLSDCFIFSNSFSEIIENSTEDTLKSDLRYLYRISSDCVKDLKINSVFKFTDIFNNLSLHTFPKDKLLCTISDNSFELIEPINFVKEE